MPERHPLSRIPVGPLLAILAIVSAGAFMLASTRGDAVAPPVPPVAGSATSAHPLAAAPVHAAADARIPAAIATRESQERVDALFATLDGRFVADTLDAEWSKEAERRLLDAAAEPSLTRFGIPDAYTARCRAHLCRIEMVFSDLDQADDWATFYPVEMGTAVAAVRSRSDPLPDGRVGVVMYAARAGSERLIRVRQPDPGPVPGGAASR